MMSSDGLRSLRYDLRFPKQPRLTVLDVGIVAARCHAMGCFAADCRAACTK